MTSQAPTSSNAAAVRLALNLKNLRRHDSSITAIVGQAAYVGAYWNDGTGWVKANVEGPMFLFQREQGSQPKFGFFVLNRNGLEYVQESLAFDSEVKLEGEFILFEGPNADRATGIWVHDKSEREKLCAQMEQLRKLSAPPVAAAPPASQSISLDMLFAGARSPQPAPAQPPQHQQQHQQPQFHHQQQQQQYQQPPPQQQHFQQQPPQPQQPFHAFQQAQSPPPGQGLNVQQLMSQMMLPPQQQQPQQQYMQSPPPQQQPQPAGGMGLLNAMFQSAKAASPKPAAQPIPAHVSRPLPIPAPQQQSQPQQAQQPLSPTFVGSPPGAANGGPLDAGALLAMIGMGSPTGPLPLGLPLTSPPPVQAAPLPHLNGLQSKKEAAPAPSPIEKKAVASPPPVAPSPAAAISPPPVAKSPFFAAPLLSHDLFASLPKPTPQPKKEKQQEKVLKLSQTPPPPKAKEEPVAHAQSAPEPELVKEEEVEEEQEVPAVVPAEEPVQEEDTKEESVPLPLTPEPATAPPAPVELPTAAPPAVASPRPIETPSTVASPALVQSPAMRASPAIGRPGASSRASSVSMGLGVGAGGVEMPSKDVVLQLLDEEVRRVGLGMEGQEAEDEDEEREPLDKSVFIRGVKELLAKGAFSTALYSKYLARFAEELEHD